MDLPAFFSGIHLARFIILPRWNNGMRLVPGK